MAPPLVGAGRRDCSAKREWMAGSLESGVPGPPASSPPSHRPLTQLKLQCVNLVLQVEPPTVLLCTLQQVPHIDEAAVVGHQALVLHGVVPASHSSREEAAGPGSLGGPGEGSGMGSGT